MPRSFIPIFLLPFLMACFPKQEKTHWWRPVEGQLLTRWAAEVDPMDPWPQYPRPQMKRSQWKSLNGTWEYGIALKDSDVPESWERILIPYPIQSALSGVKKMVGPDEVVFYRKSIEVPADWDNRVLVHFEASDWHTEIWLNGTYKGENQGGYHSFSADISESVVDGKVELMLKVSDPTNTGWQPVGKQVLEPGGIFYTPVTGPWQTIWMEPVPKDHISDIRIFTDIDQGQVSFSIAARHHDQLRVKAVVEGIEYRGITEKTAYPDPVVTIDLDSFRLWSPDDPVLYYATLYLEGDHGVLDSVQTYFGMRKVDLGKDGNGFTRIRLNNEPLFMNGPLDQGFWPDGIYTAPTEEAMLYDLVMTRRLGFNMTRKHVKVESKRWYYLADSLGLLVWQDMPNGDRKISPGEPDIERTEESDKGFRMELRSLIEQHINHPSIIVWVPFNEGWGQYMTADIVDYVKGIDSTRLVINASGWADRAVGDIHDIHNYPDPRTPQPEEKRAIVLGEFGGLGFPVEGHLWQEENWGYQSFTSVEQLTAKYEGMYEQVFGFTRETGLSASVYTQITDVETETNGLMTYDREVVKIDPDLLYRINTNHFVPGPRIAPAGGLFNRGDQVSLSAAAGEVYFRLDGQDPGMDAEVYSGPITLENSVTLKARTLTDRGLSRIVTMEYTLTDVPRPSYTDPYSERYTAGGDFALFDGKKGSETYNDGHWQGFERVPLQVIFEAPGQVDSISVDFLEDTRRWIFLPSRIILEASADGINFEAVFQSIPEPAPGNRDAGIMQLNIPVSGTWNYFRLTAEPALIPDWHEARGRKSWVFVDEVEW